MPFLLAQEREESSKGPQVEIIPRPLLRVRVVNGVHALPGELLTVTVKPLSVHSRFHIKTKAQG